ncbi:MAG: S41 family peptidase [Lentimicrobiaceae bacterium]|nr:S41 family peptidase [Lentimicrobiaceae bacterium]
MLKYKKDMRYLKLLFVSFLMILHISLNAQSQPRDSKDMQQSLQKLSTMYYLINNFYVDTANLESLTEEAIVAILKELDPHSAYISKEDVEKANEPLVGSFEGIGVTFQIFQDTILVISPVPGGPSDRVGIMAGDKIVTIDGEDAFGKKVNNDYVAKHLRGEKGTKVTLGIKRGKSDELIDYEVIRDKIPLNSIEAAFMLDKNVGYIKLDRFAQTSNTEFEESLAKLKTQKMKSLILDLRGNTGGYLNIAAELSNQFLKKDMTIVYTEGDKSPKQIFNTDKNGKFTDGKLIILIDEGSASASEIVSGAVQDWDRGILIGRRSFGKGLVQRPFNLPDGSQVRLTTARYYTPTGRCIQRSYEKGSEDYYNEMTKRMKHGEFYHSDSIQFPDSLKYSTLLSGRTVYGGGGIMPDIFMPVDTTFATKLYTDLIRKGIFNRFTVDYVMKNRELISNKYSDFENFYEQFEVTDEMISDFRSLAEEEGVEWNDEQFQRSEPMIQLQLKALIARNEWSQSEYYRVVMNEDKVIKKAVEILNDSNQYRKILKR